MKIEKSAFGKTPEGQAVDLYTLTNDNGNQIQMTNYGAIIVSIMVPDREGNRANVTLGFDKLDGYLARHPYFGATVGRFCNRIAKGKFTVDGKDYTLAVNNGPNHLHGGLVGYDKKVWTVEELDADKVAELKLTKTKGIGLRFKLRSPDGDEGYPGNLDVIADYVWDNDNTIINAFTANTDKSTVLNLTNHAYYNLGGWQGGEIVNHELKLAANKYLGVDDTLIPTGEMKPVAGTPMDFVQPHKIGERIDQLKETNGYDHCFVIDGQPGMMRDCAIVTDPKSGRAMQIRTTQPGVQFYTGNFLDGTEANGGFKLHEAFCLETQHYPDSPNQTKFPTTLLKPTQTFKEVTTIRFYTVK